MPDHDALAPTQITPGCSQKTAVCQQVKNSGDLRRVALEEGRAARPENAPEIDDAATYDVESVRPGHD